MVEIQFEDPRAATYPGLVRNTDRRPGMVRLLIAWGMAQDEKGARNILIGLIVVCLLVSVYLIYRTVTKATPVFQLSQEDQTRIYLPENLK